MNYLAHLYLADDTDESILGNLLGDFVKGFPKGRYSMAITSAIIFHRKVDSFTDAHPIPRSSRNRVSKRRRRFAGIIVDVCYDHFLARYWQHFAKSDLRSYTKRVYSVLDQNRALLPKRLQRILPKMVSEDWLNSYMSLNGVACALNRIAARLSRGNAFMSSVVEIESNYSVLEQDFLDFFPELITFAVAKKPVPFSGSTIWR
jgi:acyl carrier protein phosphodiesterase